MISLGLGSPSDITLLMLFGLSPQLGGTFVSFDAHKNFAVSLIAVAPTPAASGTTFSITPGDGALFPAVPFNAVIWPAGTHPTAANAEIVRVMASGTGDNWTATRTTETSNARSIAVGDQICAAITAKTLTDVEAAANAAAQNLVGPVTFPAIQVPSSNVNCLDDYEEGSWTPVLGGSGGTSGQTYTTQVGRYIKVGKLVTCFCQVTFSAKGTITGSLQIQGLPFTSENTAGAYGGLQCGDFANMATVITTLYGIVPPNVTYADIRASTATAVATSGQPDTSFVGNTTSVVCKITYQASA